MLNTGKLNGIVYDPPAAGFPYVAVVFKPDGEVLVARSVATREAGEAIIATSLAEFNRQRKAGEI